MTTGATTATAFKYRRLSFFKDDGQLTLDGQDQACDALVARVGATVVGAELDEVSAFDKEAAEDRIGYLTMCAAIRKGGIDYVVAWHTSRLWRSTIDQAMFLRDAAKYGVKAIITENATIDPNNPDDVMTATILGAVDARESAVKQVRIRSQKTLARAAHRTTNPVIALGWLGTRHGAERNDGTQVHEGEAELIRDAAQRVLAGTSLSTIAREWNANGIVKPYTANRVHADGTGRALPKTKRAAQGATGDDARGHKLRGNGECAGQWQPGHIKAILTNPRNAGHQVHDGQVINRDVWPAIIDADTFERITKHFERRARGPRAGGNRGPWAGIVKCAACGATMLYQPAYRASGASFKCARIAGREACGKTYAPASTVERMAHAWLVEHVDGAELNALVANEDVNVEANLLHELAECNADNDAWFRMLKSRGFDKDRVINEARYAEAKAETDARIEKINHELALLGTPDVLAEYRGRGDVLAELLANPELSADAHRAMFTATKHHVWITPAPYARARFTDDRVLINVERPAV